MWQDSQLLPLYKIRVQFSGSFFIFIAFSRDNEYFKVFSNFCYVNLKNEVKSLMMQFYVKNLTGHRTSNFTRSGVIDQRRIILKLYFLDGALMVWFHVIMHTFMASITRSTITIDNGGTTTTTVNHNTTNTSFTMVVAIIIVASFMAIVLVIVITNIIILFVTRFFIFLIITMFIVANMLTFICMDVFQWIQHPHVFHHHLLLQYQFHSIKGVLKMNLFTIDQKNYLEHSSSLLEASPKSPPWPWSSLLSLSLWINALLKWLTVDTCSISLTWSCKAF